MTEFTRYGDIAGVILDEWDQDAQTLEDFDDVRKIQAELKSKGIPLAQEADPSGTGPGSILVFDPDGNGILIDQHI